MSKDSYIAEIEEAERSYIAASHVLSLALRCLSVQDGGSSYSSVANIAAMKAIPRDELLTIQVNALKAMKEAKAKEQNAREALIGVENTPEWEASQELKEAFKNYL